MKRLCAASGVFPATKRLSLRQPNEGIHKSTDNPLNEYICIINENGKFEFALDLKIQDIHSCGYTHNTNILVEQKIARPHIAIAVDELNALGIVRTAIDERQFTFLSVMPTY